VHRLTAFAAGRGCAIMRRELSPVIVDERFDWLDAPVLRVTYPDTHCAFSHVLEEANLPNANKIADALRRLAAY
jgi:pyruvate/2-oxoglutarate/acetoin dehydrogenase E1 component